LLLEVIIAKLGFGIVYIKEHSAHLRVERVRDVEKLIKFLDDNPLITHKRADFELFKQGVEIIKRGEHLTIEGLRKIVSIRASMNWGLPEALKKAFPNTVPMPRPSFEVNLRAIPNPNWWLAGFVDAEGCFFIAIEKSNTCLSGVRVRLKFQITQHTRDEELLKKIAGYLGCGRVNVRSNELNCDYICNTFSDIQGKIIPFFKDYPLKGAKIQSYLYFCQAAELINTKAHLTPEGLAKIVEIKSRINTG
jgi:hypothetical protein